MISKETLKNRKVYKDFVFFSAILFLSIILFIFAFFSSKFSLFNSNIGLGLSVHSALEISSIFTALYIFLIAYYTYSLTKNARFLLFGLTLFYMSFMDLFHLLSSSYMPDFIISNINLNRSDAFWITSRLIGASGVLIISLFFNEKKKINLKPLNALLFTVFIVIFFLLMITFLSFGEGSILQKINITQFRKIVDFFVSIILFISAYKIIKKYRVSGKRILIFIFTSILLGGISEMYFAFSNQLLDTFSILGHTYKVISYFTVFSISFKLNISEPYKRLQRIQNELQKYAQKLDKIVNNRTKEVQKMNEKFIEDLEYARDIQRAMLPKELPRGQNYSFTCRYFPAEKVSGDFYNVFEIDEKHIGMYIGDVAGHGVPAAMLTVFANQNIQSIKENNNGDNEILSPSDVLNKLYKAYNKTNFREEVYFVILYAIFNIENRKLTYSSAGMNVQPVILRKNCDMELLDISGFPICKFMEFYNFDYKDKSLVLNEGDKIFFYTDGVIDAINTKNEPLSEERLHDILIQNSHKNGEIITDILTSEIVNYTSHMNIKDDITWLMLDIHSNL